MGRGRSSSPVTKKKTASGAYGGLRFAMSSMQGWRPAMEDTHRVSLKLPGHLNDWAYAGMFDGHSGKTVATYASKNLLQKILNNINKMPAIPTNGQPPTAQQQTQITDAITQGFLNLDGTMSKSKIIKDLSGSTAVCMMLSPTHIYIANCGDSRAVLSREGRVHFSTTDHKPSNKLERQRIEAAGGYVHKDRVDGRLAMSRALGDFDFKGNQNMSQLEQRVIPMPDVTIIERNTLLDEFVVLACDGIFDVMSNRELINFIRNEMTKVKDLKTICNRVIDHCFQIGSQDNMSIIILTLPGCPSKVELKRKRKSDLAQMNKAIRAKKANRAPNGGNLHVLDNDEDDDDEMDQGIADQNNNVVELINNVVIPAVKEGKKGVKNPFIIYFMDYWKKNGGNICEAAKLCGEKWPTLSKEEKRKYRRRYLYARRVRDKKAAAAAQQAPSSPMLVAS